MSKGAKISFLIAFLLLVAGFAVQLMTGVWINLNHGDGRDRAGLCGLGGGA